MDRIEIARLPRDHHAVDDFADQAAGDLEQSGRLEALERSSDGLTAKPGRSLQASVGWRAIAVRGAMECQHQGSQDAKAYLAHDAIAGSSGPCTALQGLSKREDAGALVAIERPAMLASVGNEPGAAAKVVSHG